MSSCEKNITRDPVWYPFTQMKEYLKHSPISIKAGEGNWLITEDGTRYLDGISSLWANIHGHRHPRLNQAISEQLNRIAHTTMLGLTHEGGIELARRLIALAPESLSRVFYSDSGATSVEIAIKMAYQYQQLRGKTNKKKILHMTEAYHGDTVGSVSVGGIDIFHDRFRSLLFETIAVPTPHLYRHCFGDISEAQAQEKYFAKLEELIIKHKDEACAFVIEPLMQGAAGMIQHPEGYLEHVRRLTKEHDILLICDEVAVGFGRTGKMFASEWENVCPDLMCLGKGITGGYLPLAATLTSEEIFSAFLGEYSEAKTFYHGHTYTGNPLACAAALASLEVFCEERTLSPAVFGPKAERYAKGMERLLELPHVGSARFRGMMGGVELVKNKETREPYGFEERIGNRVIEEARKYNVMVRPLGDVIVLLPPLSIKQEELDLMFEAIEKSIVAITS